MAARPPSNPPSTDAPVRVARIGAVQGIAVALIAALAGIAGTAGVKYFDQAVELKRVQQELVDARDASAKEIDELMQRVAQLTRNTSARVFIFRSTAKHTPTKCLETIIEAMQTLVPEPNGVGGGEDARLGLGGEVSRGGYQVRFLCEPDRQEMLVAVAGVTGTRFNDVEAVAAGLQAALK